MKPQDLSHIIIELKKAELYLVSQFPSVSKTLEVLPLRYASQLNQDWGPVFKEFVLSPEIDKCRRWQEFFLTWLRFGFSVEENPINLRSYLSLKLQSISNSLSGALVLELTEIEDKINWVFKPWDFSRPFEDPAGEFLFDRWLFFRQLAVALKSGLSWKEAALSVEGDTDRGDFRDWIFRCKNLNFDEAIKGINRSSKTSWFEAEVQEFLVVHPMLLDHWVEIWEWELGLRDFSEAHLSVRDQRRGLRVL